MRLALRCLSILILLILISACAVADVARTPVPPLTLGPAPIIQTAGSCDKNADLEAWAQAAYYLTTEFVSTFKAAVAKPRDKVFDDVLALQDARTNLISRPTPGCALDAQKATAEAMDAAIRAVQSYSNGDLGDLSSKVPALNAQMDAAVSQQTTLINLYRSRLPTPSLLPTATSAGGRAGG